MAKDISIAQALAALEAIGGVTLTEEQMAKVAEAARSEMLDAARTVVANKLSKVDGENSKTRNTRVHAWADKFMSFSDEFAKDFPTVLSNRGQGQRNISMIRIETPAGSLKIELSADVDETEESE
jgi:hypothetical protein